MKKALFSFALFLGCFFPVLAYAATPTVTVSGTSVSLLNSSLPCSITVSLIDPNNTGMLKAGSNIVTGFTSSTVTTGGTCTVGPIWGNDVIQDGFGNLNSTYYKVQVFLVSGGIIASTPSLQAFYSFIGSGTIDLSTATPLSPSFQTGTLGNITVPGNLTVTGTIASANIAKINSACYLDGVGNASLAAAVTCAGTNGTIIIPPFASPTLVANTTIPVGVTTIFQGGAPGQITLGNFNLTINGPIVAPVSQIFIYGGTGRVTLGVGALGTEVRSEWFPGATWCDQANAADAAFSAIGGKFVVGQNPVTNSCGANISISASHVMKASAGFYSLGSQSIIPNGIGASVTCDSWFANFNYTGTAFAYDLNTQTQTHLLDCQISLGTTAAGAIRIRNTGNAFETRAYMRGVYISAPVNTGGQIGIYLEGTNATSANYHSELEIQVQNIDIGAEFKSLVNNQGANGNHLSIRCNGHTICVQHFDGTDNIIQGTILGAKGGGNGIGINLCAAGNGGYGSSNDVFGPLSVEQGSTGGGSTTINVASGAGLTNLCGNSVVMGQTNDASSIVDANATSTMQVLFNTIAAFRPRTLFNPGTAAVPTIADSAAGSTGRFFSAGGLSEESCVGTACFEFTATGSLVGNTMGYGWAAAADPNGTRTTNLGNPAPGVISADTTTVGNTLGFWKSANTNRVGTSGFTTANNANLQTITGLSWTIPANALNWSFACDLSYSQATANAAVAFGIQAATNAPTNIFANGTEQITVGPPATFVTGTLATLNTTTATAIVSGTPTAIATNYTVHLAGTIENPASANTINIMVSTAAGADAVTVLRGSTCYFTP